MKEPKFILWTARGLTFTLICLIFGLATGFFNNKVAHALNEIFKTLPWMILVFINFKIIQHNQKKYQELDKKLDDVIDKIKVWEKL